MVDFHTGDEQRHQYEIAREFFGFGGGPEKPLYRNGMPRMG